MSKNEHTEITTATLPFLKNTVAVNAASKLKRRSDKLDKNSKAKSVRRHVPEAGRCCVLNLTYYKICLLLGNTEPSTGPTPS